MCVHNGHNMCIKELCIGASCHKVYEILFIIRQFQENMWETAGNTIGGKRRKRDSVAHNENISLAYNSSLDFYFSFIEFLCTTVLRTIQKSKYLKLKFYF